MGNGRGKRKEENKKGRSGSNPERPLGKRPGPYGWAGRTTR